MRRSLAAALAIACWCPAPATAAQGDLDSSFGRYGLVHSDVGGADRAEAIALQPDGRIVVAGYSDVDPYGDPHEGPGKLDFTVARYTAAGRLDSGFGTGGHANLALGGQDEAYALALQPNGGILVGGQSRLQRDDLTAYGVFALARFGSTGRPDRDFGPDGWITIPETASNFSTVRMIWPLADSRILVIGTTYSASGVTGTLLIRLWPDGTPDTSFGPNGVRALQLHATPSTFLIDSRGGLLVAGSDTSGTTVERFSLDGQPDLGFAQAGLARLGSEGGPVALAQQPSGAIVAATRGVRYGDPGKLIRLTATGVLDQSFGVRGSAETISPSSLAVDDAGRIVVASSGFQLVRHAPNGARDRHFRTPRVPKAYRSGPGTHVVVTREGDLVAADWVSGHVYGEASSDYDFGVARFHGGVDVRPPLIRVLQRPRGCRGDALRLLVVDGSGHFRVVVRLDGHRALATRRSRSLLRLHPGRLRLGRHVLVIRARDAADKVAVRTLRFKRCP